MIIKIGDNVTVTKDRSMWPREGTVTGISIATHQDDPAGEGGVKATEYDTILDYAGSIDYVTEKGEHYWAYFSQVETAERQYHG
tara:strand:- start:32 stop:283 length:252 start_codon:yes stop_codon:yes gene_type:complete